MLEASPGEPASREDLHEIVIRALTSDESILISSHIQKGIDILRQAYPEIGSRTEPMTIVKAIAASVDAYRAHMSHIEQIDFDAPICTLGWLWLEQLCRAYNWEWLCWEANGEEQHYAAFSPDKKYVSFAPTLIALTINVRRRPNRIRELFTRLGHVSEPRQLQEAFMYNWVMFNPYHNRYNV